MEINDSVELEIADSAYRGAGVGRIDGAVVFVPDSAPGEKIKAVITKKHKKFYEGRIEEVITASADRIEPCCPLVTVCQGCCYQHLAYPAEVALKQKQLENFISRFTPFENCTFPEPAGSPEDMGYRNKIVLHASRTDGIKLGYYAEDNRSVIDVPQCPLAKPEINDLLTELRGDKEFMDKLAEGDPLTLRWTSEDGSVYLTRSGPTSAETWLRDGSPLGTLSYHRKSFSQVNPSASSLLVDAVCSVLTELKPKVVIDLYCGVGVFALAAVKQKVELALGIDSSRASINAAKRNSKELNLKAARFAVMKADEGIDAAFEHSPGHQSVLIADPPRTGLTDTVLASISRHKPRSIIYVSCAPDTMTRDLKPLRRAGYDLKSCQLVDLFPRTYCFETVAHLALR